MSLLLVNITSITDMEDFSNIKWNNATAKHELVDFINNEAAAGSNIFKYLENPFERHQELGLAEKPRYPGSKYVLQKMRDSKLSIIDQRKCLQALKMLQSGKNPENFNEKEKNLINNFYKSQVRITAENQQYQQMAKTAWAKDIKKLIKQAVPKKKAIIRYWQTKRQKLKFYSRYYKDPVLLPYFPSEAETSIEFKHAQNFLELGIVAKFTPPLLRERICLSGKPKPKELNESSKLPVSRDENIKKLVEENNIDIVISSSALKYLGDISDPKADWVIPISVEIIETKGAVNSKKKVIFVDNPVYQPKRNILDCAFLWSELLLKSETCKYEAISFENENNPIQKDPQTFHHNVSYRLWNISLGEKQSALLKTASSCCNINMLVRCKMDACELNEFGALQPVVLFPKIEQQPLYGANIPSKKELAREWISMFFRPFSNLYRMRIDMAGEMLSLEHCSAAKIMKEAQTHYEYKPNIASGVIYKVLKGLIENTNEGKYILRHTLKNEAFVELLKESTEIDFTFDLMQFDKDLQIDQHINWLPIDPNYILPHFEKAQRLPATFTPPIRLFNKKKPNKKQKKKKKANKQTPVQL